MKNIIIAIISIAVLSGCGKSEQEKYMEMQPRRAQEQPAAPQPTAEPEPTAEPTAVPKDSKSDIIYANGSKFLVTYGSADLTNGIVIYKSVEVPEGQDQEDILWVVPGGLIVTEKYAHKVRKIQ